MTEKTYHGTLVGKKMSKYTVYVFQLDDGTYSMCTLLPNWGSEYNIDKGDSGFVTEINVKAGETYYDRVTGESKIYQYDKTYLQEFIKDKLQSEIIL